MQFDPIVGNHRYILCPTYDLVVSSLTLMQKSLFLVRMRICIHGMQYGTKLDIRNSILTLTPLCWAGNAKLLNAARRKDNNYGPAPTTVFVSINHALVEFFATVTDARRIFPWQPQLRIRLRCRREGILEPISSGNNYN